MSSCRVPQRTSNNCMFTNNFGSCARIYDSQPRNFIDPLQCVAVHACRTCVYICLFLSLSTHSSILKIMGNRYRMFLRRTTLKFLLWRNSIHFPLTHLTSPPLSPLLSTFIILRFFIVKRGCLSLFASHSLAPRFRWQTNRKSEKRAKNLRINFNLANFSCSSNALFTRNEGNYFCFHVAFRGEQ